MEGMIRRRAASYSHPARPRGRGAFLLGLLLLLTLCLTITRWPHAPSVRANTASFPDPSNFNSPYGFTLRAKVNATFVNEATQLGVSWVRDQLLWSQIEQSPGVYTWGLVDQQVQFANANHLHLVFVIQHAPTWHLSIVCGNGHAVFGADDVTSFATALASRYNGLNGKGYIDAYEIGNEEFAAATCTSGSVYATVLQAGYQAIKAQSPNALVGMFGFVPQSISYLQRFLTDMYNALPDNGIKDYFDYANFHYYSSFDPFLPVPGRPDFPTFSQKWQTMQAIMAAHGDGNKPIWVTEVGWPNTDPPLQNQAMQEVFDQARLSNVVQKVFWYSINWDKTFDINPGDLTAGLPPQPAFYTYQNYVQQYPTWPPTASPPIQVPPGTLMVNPTGFNANTDCLSMPNGGWTCTATLSSDAQAQGSLNWTATARGMSGIRFTPSGGALLPGQAVQVTIALPAKSCPAKASLSFAGSANTDIVAWSC